MPNLVAAVIRGSLRNPIIRTKSKDNLRFCVRTASLASIAALALSTTSTVAAMASTVPLRMHLTDTMKNSASWLPVSSLIPIDFSAPPIIGEDTIDYSVTEEIASKSKGSDIISQNAGTSGSICFVVRRPGWVLCREHGQQLTELAASEPTIFSNFGIFGVIKETGVDDEGLRVFQKDHFSFPLYRDENLDFYRAFGDASITDDFRWWYLINPLKIINFFLGMRSIGNRMKSKNLEGNLVGEGLKKGGIIIFGSDGEPKYAYPEITGEALVTNDILAALKDVSDSTKDEL